MAEFNGTREQFLNQAREYAQRLYGYAEFADDNEDRIDVALEVDETPEYFIERLAEKYGLERV